MMTEDQIRVSFVRQRRNLIAISLVLFFVQFGEVSIKDIKLVETTLLINHPGAVNWALWTAFFYWFYRYYVYFRDAGDKGFRDTQRARLAVLVQRWFKKKFDTDSTWKDKRIENMIELLKKSNQTAYQRVTKDLQSQYEWKQKDDPDTILLGAPRFQKIIGQVTLYLYVKGTSEEWMITHQGHDQVAIEGLEAMKLNSRAIAYVLANTRILSEYYLPYLIALTPMVYFLLTR